jgi:hypothetical protein
VVFKTNFKFKFVINSASGSGGLHDVIAFKALSFFSKPTTVFYHIRSTPLLAGAEGAGKKYGFNCVHPPLYLASPHSLMRPPPIEHIT